MPWHERPFVKQWSMQLVLAAITLIASVAATPSDEIFSGKSTNAPAGEPLKGFAVSLAPNVNTVPMGAPIVVTVEVRNVLGKLQYASVGPRNAFFSFKIFDDATGESVARNVSSTFGFEGMSGPKKGRAWGAGRAVFLKFRLDLLYDFQRAVTYSIDVSKTMLNIDGTYEILPPSNAVTLRLRQTT